MKLTRILSHLFGLAFFALLAAGSTDDSNTGSSYRPEEPFAFTESNAGIYCRDVIKSLLRDPDSYKYEAAVVSSSNEALIKFRSRNGFGGYNQGLAQCTQYKKDGSNWFRAKLLTK